MRHAERAEAAEREHFGSIVGARGHRGENASEKNRDACDASQPVFEKDHVTSDEGF
ncbi:hypothetical protein YK56LOC_24120 [Caballeronia sp. HLA56]